jgi:hypothetical protein
MEPPASYAESLTVDEELLLLTERLMEEDLLLLLSCLEFSVDLLEDSADIADAYKKKSYKMLFS